MPLPRDRENAKIYLRYTLNNHSYTEGTFDEDLDVWIDNFMKPGNMQGGFNWYTAANELRLKAMREGPLDVPKSTLPTCVLWGKEDRVLRHEWTDRLGDYFSDLHKVKVVPEVRHFVHYEKPDLVNAEIINFFNSL